MTSIKRTVWTAVGLLGLVAIFALPAAADQQILDDLIVDGSACIGQDCVNGESFGFDTLRLKENNLRIKAQDTSNTSSFPTQDWQLTFNDSSNGGANKFSIDGISPCATTPFTIEACAPTHSLYIDDSGRIGFGTSTPVVNLHVKDGNTPTLRLEQDGSSGFTPQTWDVAGNEANFFIRDATNGSTLPFRIFPGAPSDTLSLEAATGDVGFGTTTPLQPIHIRRTDATDTVLLVENITGTENVSVILDNADTNAPDGWDMRVNTNGNFQITEVNSGAQEFQINGTNGNVTIANELTVSGVGGCTGCDEVFDADYYVPPIQEHAAEMWQNGYLPGIGPSPVDKPINVFRKTAGILNELEKAHIYIEQLHKRLAEVETRLAADEAGGKSVD